MAETLNQLYLIKVDDKGQKSEVPISEAPFLVGNCGTVNFGFNSSISSVPELGQDPTYSLIAGGSYNSTSGAWGVVAGGLFNSNRGYLAANIGGGIFNQVVGSYGTIAGGYWNCIGYIMPGFKYDQTIRSHSFIGNGAFNKIEINSGDYNYGLSAVFNSIVGGCNNNIRGSSNSFIGGGACNVITGNRPAAFISSGYFATILGGCCNTINGNFSSILNGDKNSIYSNASSILAGRCVTILSNHSGSTILSDTQSRTHISSGPHTLTLDFASGTYIKNKVIIQDDNQIPVNYTSFGISGQVAFDKDYLYRHNGTNWTRTAMSIW
jgi:hypothetical protein